MLIEDHVKIYTKEELQTILDKFFNKEKFEEKEKFVLMGVLQKYAELIDTYKYSNLIKYSDYVKKELELGIFEDIIVKGKTYTNNERKQLVKLSQKWSRDTLNKYQNLELLKTRMLTLPTNKHIEHRIGKITEILKMDLEEIISCSETIKKEIDEVFLYYEAQNREDIINRVYNPENKDEIVVDNLSKLGDGALLHFFGPYSIIFSFEDYIRKLETNYNRKFTNEEKNAAKDKFKVMSNNYIVNQSVPMIAIGQLNEFYRYSVDVHNQLSSMFITAEDIYKMKGIRGNLALGFSKKTLEPEQIATISNKNIHSNKNIENIETENDFKDLSATYDELLNKEENEPNTEIVMYRNTDLTTLKPSYVFYISYQDINSKHERSNIEIYKEQMKCAGLNVPFVIFDNYTIKKELEKEIER